MHFSTALASLGLLASSALAIPTNFPKRTTLSGQSVLYWGQNGGGLEEDNDLSAYCTTSVGVDIIILAFLYEYGNGNTTPGGGFGVTCTVSSGNAEDCTDVASAITTCQENGIKVFVSLGGASGGYSLTSEAEAEAIGQYLWEAYGNPTSTSVSRPFGDVIINGFDFDIENADGSEYYQYLISTLRSNFADDTENTYYISGAPQCPIPEPNMGVIIQESEFDYLWVQFYNNNNDFDNNTYESCALGIPDTAPFNYDQWASFLTTTASSSAELFIGVPAGPLGANGGTAGEVYYATPDQLATIVSDTRGNSTFGGVMMWSAGFSDNNVNNDCTYAQEVDTILLTGDVCSDGFTLTPTVTAVVPTPAFPTTSASASGTGTPVAEWGQV
jgi:chitinase